MEVVWEEWKRGVTSAVERGIGLKKVVPAREKSWWYDEIEEERWRSCKTLRRAQRDSRNE